jgi:hypothetical protein
LKIELFCRSMRFAFCRSMDFVFSLSMHFAFCRSMHFIFSRSMHFAFCRSMHFVNQCILSINAFCRSMRFVNQCILSFYAFCRLMYFVDQCVLSNKGVNIPPRGHIPPLYKLAHRGQTNVVLKSSGQYTNRLVRSPKRMTKRTETLANTLFS